MNFFEAIKARKSVRTFDGRPLTDADVTMVERAVADAGCPFGGHIYIKVYTASEAGLKVPSTYGVIKGARTFILVGTDEAEAEASTLSAGFACEAAVVEAAARGIGTCWLGGTFSRRDFAPAAEMPEGFRLTAVIAAGYATERRRIADRIMRRVVSADSRKPFGELFFDRQWGQPLGEDSEWYRALEAVRLAPSSTNSQPWRAIADGNRVDFYYKPGRYALLDMGIAVCHFLKTSSGVEMTGEATEARHGDFRFLARFRKQEE